MFDGSGVDRIEAESHPHPLHFNEMLIQASEVSWQDHCIFNEIMATVRLTDVRRDCYKMIEYCERIEKYVPWVIYNKEDLSFRYVVWDRSHDFAIELQDDDSTVIVTDGVYEDMEMLPRIPQNPHDPLRSLLSRFSSK